VAAQAHAVTTRTPPEDVHPPAWAEAVLRALLEARNRDTVSGDLLEEYRETIVPARSGLGARMWYIRQVASFVTRVGLTQAAIGWSREGAMFDKLAGKSLVWLVAGSVAPAGLLVALIRSNFGPPAGLGLFLAISVMLGASAVIATGARADFRSLWRIGLVCGILVTLVLVIRLLFEVLDPVDPVEWLLARVRDDYSVFNYPRRWIPAAAVALILIGGGLHAAWRTARVGMGTLAALTASLFGSLVYVALVALGNTLPLGPQDPLGNSPRDLQFFGNVPSMLIPVLAMFSTVLGTIGALFGRALAAARASQSHG
jgi:hypothetical protein